MPYNIFYIAFFAIVLGIAVALLTRFGKPAQKPQVLPEPAFEERRQHTFDRPVGAAELRGLAVRLLARYGIQVEGEDRSSDRDFYLIGSSEDPVVGGRYVLNCHVAEEQDEVLPPERILEFRDFVRAQGLTRGVFVTTGYFAKESRFLVEDAPVSLLSRGDVKKLLEA
ncbi:MAG: restriction endonuclease [Candidatus Krumholzibacteriia bacterium]